jgi:three-Cys-motif partner protein
MQNFGGIWTEVKLLRVKKYLGAYTKIMSKTNFRFVYIDAFAGTGYRNLSEEDSTLTLPGFEKEDSKESLEGSVKIALNISPHFHKYIFIENDKEKCNELTKIKKEYLDFKH